MRLLQTPALAFVQTRVHYVSCFLVRKTLQMMVGMNNFSMVINMLQMIMTMTMNCDKYNDDAI